MDIVLYTEGDLKLGIESDLRFVRIDFTFQMETLHLVIIPSLVKNLFLKLLHQPF